MNITNITRSVLSQAHQVVSHAKNVREEVLDKFWNDVTVASDRLIKEMVRMVVLPAFQSALVPLYSELLEPVEKDIPEEAVGFIDVKQVCC